MATRTYLQTMAEINRLSAQAEKLRKAEIAGVIARMKEAIRAYGITAADLNLDGAAPANEGLTRTPASKKSPPRSPSPLKQAMASAEKAVRAKRDKAPKFRDPASGKTWNGLGKPPAWIAGQDRSAFAIDASAPATSPVDGTKAAKVAKKAANKARASRKATKVSDTLASPAVAAG